MGNFSNEVLLRALVFTTPWIHLIFEYKSKDLASSIQMVEYKENIKSVFENSFLFQKCLILLEERVNLNILQNSTENDFKGQ